MEKAIEIKRRAQRCIQNGDLDGALAEYEKLVGIEDTDPYNFVLLADLLYKKGDHSQASSRYLSAVTSYERAALYKNAIAVCKKMLRLSLSPATVTKHLANLHALDGLAGEASLYYVQYAEHAVRANEPDEAVKALRNAFDTCNDNVRVLEQLAEAHLLVGDPAAAAQALIEAGGHYLSRGQRMDADRVQTRARQLDTTSMDGLPRVGTPEVHASRAQAEAEPTAAAFGFERTVLGANDEPAAAPHGAGSSSFERDPFAAAASAVSASFASAPPPAAEPAAVEPEPEALDIAEPQEGEAIDLDAELGGDATSFDLPDADDEPEVTVIEIEDEVEGPTPPEPGLAFDAPAAASPPPARVADPAEIGAAQVERLLADAQQAFRAGDRTLASETLARAAQAYETIGRHDSAATIYRSLGRGADAPGPVLELWLANCEVRDDRREAAQVACELGDRALNTGDSPRARDWFAKALAFDADNETASRRLQRLEAMQESGAPVATATPRPAPMPGVSAAAAAVPEPADAAGRVEVALGRGEAVSFDLGALLAEFQRGVQQQLSDDAQSHYDLGMTYREMGLLEQAVDAFRVASRDAGLAGRAAEMIGRCLAEQGRHQEAAAEFVVALDVPGLDPASSVDLRYRLGAALEAAGNAVAAMAEYEKVQRLHPGFSDVEQRIIELRGAAGNG